MFNIANCFLLFKEHKYDLPVDSDELFMAAHTKKIGVWVDSRAQHTYVSYWFTFAYIIYISNLLL